MEYLMSRQRAAIIRTFPRRREFNSEFGVCAESRDRTEIENCDSSPGHGSISAVRCFNTRNTY